MSVSRRAVPRPPPATLPSRAAHRPRPSALPSRARRRRKHARLLPRPSPPPPAAAPGKPPCPSQAAANRRGTPARVLVVTHMAAIHVKPWRGQRPAHVFAPEQRLQTRRRLRHLGRTGNDHPVRRRRILHAGRLRPCHRCTRHLRPRRGEHHTHEQPHELAAHGAHGERLPCIGSHCQSSTATRIDVSTTRIGTEKLRVGGALGEQRLQRGVVSDRIFQERNKPFTGSRGQRLCKRPR